MNEFTKPDVQYARNDGVALAYQVVGNGPRDLLLVSGYLSNIEYAWSYPSLRNFLARIASFTRLILVDRRGSGLSDRVSEPPSFETSIRDLELVLDEVGSPKTTLFGIWDGCETSILFAATHPRRVTSLVLFSSSPAQMPKDDYPWGWDECTWDEWLASIRDGWGTRAWIVRNARWMGPAMLDDAAELEHWITYTRLAASPSSAEAVMRNQKHTDIREILPAVQAPTLVLHRSGDQIEVVEAGRYVASKIPGAEFVELAGDDGIPWLGDPETVVAQLERFVGRSGDGPPHGNRRLATILVTDIVDSTSRAAAIGDARWRDLLEEHELLVRAEIARWNGRFIDSAGDGVLATFDGPAAAIGCARAAIEILHGLGLEIRAGIHTGEVEFAGERVRGIAVHTGARISAQAAPSEIWASATVRDVSAGSGLSFEEVGQFELKGIPGGPRALYRVT